MKKTSFIYLLLLIALGLSSCQQEKTFKVLQFNIWQEGAVAVSYTHLTLPTKLEV